MTRSSIVNSTTLIKSVLLTKYFQINIHYQLLESEKTEHDNDKVQDIYHTSAPPIHFGSSGNSAHRISSDWLVPNT